MYFTELGGGGGWKRKNSWSLICEICPFRRWRSPTESWDEFLLNARWKMKVLKASLKEILRNAGKSFIHQVLKFLSELWGWCTCCEISACVMVWVIKIVTKTEFFSANVIAVRQLLSYHQGGVWVPRRPRELCCVGQFEPTPGANRFHVRGPTKVHADPWRSLERVRLDLFGFGLSSVNGLFLKVICLSGYSIKPFTVHPSWLERAVFTQRMTGEALRNPEGKANERRVWTTEPLFSVPSSPKELSHKQ